jgi:TorA maturation chaperone TorD
MDTTALAGAAARRSGIYWTLSELFLTCPDAQFVARLRRALRPQLGSEASDQLVAALKAMHPALPEHATDTEELAVEYTRLFGAVSPTYGLPPPYETVHRPSAAPAELCAQIDRCYSSSGLAPIDRAVPSDHIGVELKFLALLCHDESEAWRKGAIEDALRLLRQERSFLYEHLVPWVPDYVATLKRSTRHPIYGLLASLTSQVIAADGQFIEEMVAD